MRTLVLILCLLLSSLVMGQATGNLWISYESAKLDSGWLFLRDANGLDTLLTITDAYKIDTLIDADSLTSGLNVFEWVGYYEGETKARNAYDFFNNYASGGTAAAGSLTVAYDVALCDSIMFIHEVAGSYDTLILTDSYGFDTTFNCASLTVGVHNFVSRFLYDGATDWLTGFDIFHNSSSSSPEATTANYCAVTLTVLNSNGTPAAYVPCTAYLGGHNLADSSGQAISNTLLRERTNSLGVVTFDCMWSSYIVPATDWWFLVHSWSVTGPKKIVTVPRQVSYSVTFGN